MKGIILNTEQEAIDLVAEVDSKFRFLFKGLTVTYTDYIKHPTEEKFIVMFRERDIDNMQEQFPNLIASMSFTPNDIIELTDDWNE